MADDQTRRCRGTTRAGKPCRARHVGGDGWCGQHRPGRTRRITTPSGELTDAQTIAARTLAAGSTVVTAAEIADVDRSTVHAWTHLDAFQAEMERQRRLIAAEAIDLVRAAAQKAAGIVMADLDNPDPDIQRSAALFVLKTVGREVAGAAFDVPAHASDELPDGIDETDVIAAIRAWSNPDLQPETEGAT